MRVRASLRRILQRSWLTHNWLSALLLPIAALFGTLVRARAWLYRHGWLRSTGAGVATVIVGNVIVGGSGKTPLLLMLVAYLQQQGYLVGVISRGYGRREQHCMEVRAHTPVAESGDEPAHIKRASSAPVFVANKRIDAARALLEAYPRTQVLLCDDGLQHYALKRDIEIAVFDRRGIGNGRLLPAGLLREPWPRRRQQGIDLIVHSEKAPVVGGFVAWRRLADHAVDAAGRRTPLSALTGKTLIAVAAIAKPEEFFSMLAASSVKLQRTIGLPDHDDFGNFVWPAPAPVTVLCTEKDAVKLFTMARPSTVELLAVPLLVGVQSEFFTAFDALLKPLIFDAEGETL